MSMRQGRRTHVSQKLLDLMLHHAAVSLRVVRETDPERPVKEIIEPILRFNKIRDTSPRWTNAYWFIMNNIEKRARELATEPSSESQHAEQRVSEGPKIHTPHRRHRGRGPEIDEISRIDPEFAADLSVEIRPISKPLNSGYQRAREGNMLPPPKEQDDT